MILNPKIKEIIKNNNLNELESMLFLNLWWFKKYYPKADQMLFITLASGQKIINLDNEENYRVNFLKLEDGQLTLKYPLFVKDKSETFDLFVKKIAETRLINSKGHVNNPQDYPVYDISKDTRTAFEELPDLDFDKACEVVIRYYETTKPAQKFSNYLSKGFIVDYQQFEQ